MSASLGVRVVRGPDWEWGSQDGGEGFVGTVVGVEELNRGHVLVQWDMGQRYKYRCGGYARKYDLRILDNGTTGVRHSGFACGWCACPLITGFMWKCVQCFGYWLCSRCYHAGKHGLEHKCERIDGPDSSQRSRLGSRMLTRRVMSQGMFPGAVVVRGADWRWGDQDGGPGHRGKISTLDGWEQESFRSVAHVMWSHSQSLNIYCVGHKGMVDLQCVAPSSGGFYYPEHLAILGKVYDPPAARELSTGDGVRVELDPELFKVAQEDHGGWEDYMAEYIGRDGIVQSIRYCGDVVVRYPNTKLLQVNGDCLTQVERCTVAYGDVLRVCDDMATVHQLQSGHGEWADDMALALGQVGRVVKIRANGDIRLAVNGSRWVFNPKCLMPAPGEIPIEERTGQLHVDVTSRIQALSLVEADCADVVVVAAAGGDLRTLMDYLKKHPDHVNTMYEGKAAIHMAVVESYLPIVRLLIEYHADLDIKDDGDTTALHLCAYMNNGEVAKLLMDGGADVNIKDDRGVAPLATAAGCGHLDVVQVLLDHPKTDPDIQDYEGSSPLHRAIIAHQLPSLIALLNAGANPSLYNHHHVNCMHRATGIGFLAGVEELIKWYPNTIDTAKKDGFTPLHIAAANGHTDIVSLLASHPNCDVNVKDTDGLTALHIAAHEGYPAMVERLVGYGADLSSTTSDGNTPLHLTLGRNTMIAPSELSPRILEVKRELDQLCGPDTLRPNVVVGVFLVREGASIHAVNRQGLHPLSARPPDVAQLVNSYATIHTKPPFHGKLRQMENPFADVSPKTPRRPVRVSKEPQSTPATKGPPGKIPEAVPAKKAINQSVNMNTYSPSLGYDKDINPYAKSAAASALDAVAGTCKLEPCSLCEDHPICIMVRPCGHVTLCHLCGSRAKRCMRKECRAEVKHVIQLCPVCLKNQPDSTHNACTSTENHRLCKGCIARSTKCLLCCALLMKIPSE